VAAERSPSDENIVEELSAMIAFPMPLLLEDSCVFVPKSAGSSLRPPS
jgi:hypothetical protein